ncbi:hypothetical protein CROQUDRAFT_655555, partial [Cronartium quercuum f. sp. fusiforme G11]
MVICTPPGFSGLDTLLAPKITTKINEVLRSINAQIKSLPIETDLFCPELKTYPTRFPVILHAVPTSFDPTNPSHLQELGTQHCQYIFITWKLAIAHYVQSVPQCFCCWKIGHTAQWCKNSPVCNKCMGDHNPISCKASLPSPPVCCICISHEKIASKKSVNTLDE